jgi:NAD(P)H-hydrate epimerase
VLAGLIAGLWAQGLDAFSAARAGVLVHALASERFAGKATRGMLALDLMTALLPFVNPQA